MRRRARMKHRRRVQLVGPGGLLTGLTKSVVETELEEGSATTWATTSTPQPGRNGGTARNGYRVKTVLIEVRPVEVEVPRDRDGSFDP